MSCNHKTNDHCLVLASSSARRSRGINSLDVHPGSSQGLLLKGRVLKETCAGCLNRKTLVLQNTDGQFWKAEFLCFFKLQNEMTLVRPLRRKANLMSHFNVGLTDRPAGAPASARDWGRGHGRTHGPCSEPQLGPCATYRALLMSKDVASATGFLVSSVTQRS